MRNWIVFEQKFENLQSSQKQLCQVDRFSEQKNFSRSSEVFRASGPRQQKQLPCACELFGELSAALPRSDGGLFSPSVRELKRPTSQDPAAVKRIWSFRPAVRSSWIWPHERPSWVISGRSERKDCFSPQLLRSIVVSAAENGRAAELRLINTCCTFKYYWHPFIFQLTSFEVQPAIFYLICSFFFIVWRFNYFCFLL